MATADTVQTQDCAFIGELLLHNVLPHPLHTSY